MPSPSQPSASLPLSVNVDSLGGNDQEYPHRVLRKPLRTRAVAVSTLVLGSLLICFLRSSSEIEHFRPALSQRRLTSDVATNPGDAERVRTMDALQKNLFPYSKLTEKSEPNNALPFFWHIPKAGGTSVHNFLAGCLKLQVVTSIGTLFGHENDATLQLMETPAKRTYVNVDVTTKDGIKRANKMGFVGSGLGQVIISGRFSEVVQELYSPTHQGLAFTIMRHPVERSLSMFHYLKKADWEPSYRPDYKELTLTDHVKQRSKEGDGNWMVRFLVGKPGNHVTAPLTRKDLALAKHIVKDKLMVGFVDNMQESMVRFSETFGWSSRPEFAQCIQEWGAGRETSNQNSYDTVTEESLEWQELARIDALDMELYDYARWVWAMSSTFPGVMPK